MLRDDIHFLLGKVILASNFLDYYINKYVPTMPCKNIGTNDKFCRKVALLRYTERLKFRSQSRETA